MKNSFQYTETRILFPWSFSFFKKHLKNVASVPENVNHLELLWFQHVNLTHPIHIQIVILVKGSTFIFLELISSRWTLKLKHETQKRHSPHYKTLSYHKCKHDSVTTRYDICMLKTKSNTNIYPHWPLHCFSAPT